MIKAFHHLIEILIMNHAAKNKALTWLVVLLLIANAATITMFWLGKPKQRVEPKKQPKDFLIKELKLDTSQQIQLEVLVKEHRAAVNKLRKKVKEAKSNFFDLLKEQNVSDSTKKNAAAAVSIITEDIDLLTLNHFQKVRSLCNPEQQKKFDEIIQQVTGMMGQQGPPKGPGGPGNDRPPPPDGEHGDKPTPPKE
ncbi:MAG: Spy/CpxP family protein refolding chaperone [Bacteroidota bacterium]|nr:Spy/CpxP family protein refolding chaperone [Bacteroidota bacterium]